MNRLSSKTARTVADRPRHDRPKVLEVADRLLQQHAARPIEELNAERVALAGLLELRQRLDAAARLLWGESVSETIQELSRPGTKAEINQRHEAFIEKVRALQSDEAGAEVRRVADLGRSISKQLAELAQLPEADALRTTLRASDHVRALLFLEPEDSKKPDMLLANLLVWTMSSARLPYRDIAYFFRKHLPSYYARAKNGRTQTEEQVIERLTHNLEQQLRDLRHRWSTPENMLTNPEPKAQSRKRRTVS